MSRKTTGNGRQSTYVILNAPLNTIKVSGPRVLVRTCFDLVSAAGGSR